MVWYLFNLLLKISRIIRFDVVWVILECWFGLLHAIYLMLRVCKVLLEQLNMQCSHVLDIFQVLVYTSLQL